MIRRSPLEGVALIDGLHELPFLAQLDLRLDADDAEARKAVESVIGALPIEPNTVHGGAEAAVLWLGPDEWLSSAHPTAKSPSSPSFTSPRRPRGARRHRRRLGQPNDARAPRPTQRRAARVRLPDRPPPARLRSGPLRADAPRPRQRAHLACRRRTGGHVRLFVRPSFAAYVAAWLADAADGLTD